MIWLLTGIALLHSSAAEAGAPGSRGVDRNPEVLSTPQQAVKSLELPKGFHASLFAAEPDVTQPIAIATDERGRLWVPENQTYAERAVNFDLARHDRIVILEDTDHDGKADRRKVFWDGAQRLTSVEIGFGGVWALCPPRLLFLPDRDRDDVPDVFINLHGRRVNQDTLERRGSGYVGRHAPDFARSSDPWFRAIDLVLGPDGGVYIADWSDVGECHENDAVHRVSGRIYKVVFGQPVAPPIADVPTLDDAELVQLQNHKNDWFVRQARRVLQERAVAGRPMDAVHAALRTSYGSGSRIEPKLRALWALFVTGGASPDWLLEQLKHPDEAVRAWAVRLLVDQGEPTTKVVRAFAAMAAAEPSGLVLLYLGSALQRLPTSQRWALADAIASRSEFAGDPALPLMIWYGIEPAVALAPARTLAIAESCRMPLLRLLLARRLTEDLTKDLSTVDRLVALAGRSQRGDRQRDILAGMAEALRGWRKARAPDSWEPVRAALASSSDPEVRRLVRELSVVFGDGRALDELKQLAMTKPGDPANRRAALGALVEARAGGLVPLLCELLNDRDLGPDAIRGLAAFDDPRTPTILLENYQRLRPAAREQAVATLSARPSFAIRMLEAVAAGNVDRRQVTTFQSRKSAS